MSIMEQQMQALYEANEHWMAEEARKEMGFEICEFDSEGGDCEDCGQNPSGELIYFHSGGGCDSREGSYRCERCVDAFICACLEDLNANPPCKGPALRWCREDARKAKGKLRRAKKDARIKARGTYRSGHRREIYRAKVQQLLRRKNPGLTFYS